MRKKRKLFKLGEFGIRSFDALAIIHCKLPRTAENTSIALRNKNYNTSFKNKNDTAQNYIIPKRCKQK